MCIYRVLANQYYSMYVSMCICVCVCMRMCTRAHAFMHSYIFRLDIFNEKTRTVQQSAYLSTPSYISSTPSYRSLCALQPHRASHTQGHTHAHAHAHTHTTQTQTHTHTRTHTHTCTHTCMHSVRPLERGRALVYSSCGPQISRHERCRYIHICLHVYIQCNSSLGPQSVVMSVHI